MEWSSFESLASGELGPHSNIEECLEKSLQKTSEVEVEEQETSPESESK